MKLKLLIISSFVLVMGVTAFASSGTFHANAIGFAAPTIIGTSNVYNPEVGAIVYDESTATFYGNGTTGWTALGGSAQTVPAGMIQPFAGTTAPTGYLPCDGSAVSRTTYATLFGVIGTTYGVGDGSTTFNVPNAQGVFLRGAGSQVIGAVTYTGTQGTTQGQATAVNGLHDTGHNHGVNLATNSSGVPGGNIIGSNAGVNTTEYSNVGYASLVGDYETRPANISVLYVVKY